jgi:hypothetical protein
MDAIRFLGGSNDEIDNSRGDDHSYAVGGGMLLL